MDKATYDQSMKRFNKCRWNNLLGLITNIKLVWVMYLCQNICKPKNSKQIKNIY